MRGKNLLIIGVFILSSGLLSAEQGRSVLPNIPLHNRGDESQSKGRPQSNEFFDGLFSSCKVKWKNLELRTCIQIGNSKYGVVQNSKTGEWSAVVGEEIIPLSAQNSKRLNDLYNGISNLPRHFSTLVNLAYRFYGYKPPENQQQDLEQDPGQNNGGMQNHRPQQNNNVRQMPSNLRTWNAVLAGQLPGVVLFTATWCGPCKTIKARIQQNANSVKAQWGVSSDTPIYIIDTDQYGDLYNQTQSQFGFQEGIPRAVFWKNGSRQWK